jgi:hypothetical protein
MPFIASTGGALGYGRAVKAAAATPLGGSIFFNGTTNGNLSVANNIDFRLRTGDFTIEWFQYQQALNPFPRVFSIGSYPSQSIAESIESGNNALYAWISGANLMTNIFSSNLGKWTHVAFSRQGTNFYCFVNGVQVGSTLTNSTDFNNTTELLRIGNETTMSTDAAFNGYITNFRWTKGQALYTANFSVPTRPLTPGPNTKLLLLAATSGTATTDSSGTGKTVTAGSAINWNSLTPFT